MGYVKDAHLVPQYTYVLIAEVLGIVIGKNESIQGVKITGSELKILQYADDTEIFVTTEDSIKEIYNITGKYEKSTGAKINVEKIGIWIGTEDSYHK